jgi:hypothetical protein
MKRFAVFLAVALAACGGKGTAEVIDAAVDAKQSGGAPDARAADAKPGGTTPDAPVPIPDARPPDAAAAPDAGPIGGGDVTAYRVTDLALRDPHAFLDGCTDLTDGLLSVNGQIRSALAGDANRDGDLDLNIVLLMEPLDQGGSATTSGEVVFADCTAPAVTTSCTPGNGPRYAVTLHNQAAALCLGVALGTASPGTVYTDNYPAIAETAAGAGETCFASDPRTITVTFTGISITLQDAQIAAIYDGDPATGLVTGLLRGFISEADAEATTVPLPLIGNRQLSRLLWGGKDNDCDDPDFPAGDRDVGPDGFTSGFYFYLNFTAEQRPWSE